MTKTPKFWASTVYFGYFAAIGIMGPYLIVYYQKTGISIQLVGVLLAIPTILSLFVNPMWGVIADRFKLTGKLLPFIQLLTIPTVLMISVSRSFIPILIAVLLYGICWNPVNSLMDHAVLSMLGDQSYEYGKIRIWGAVSYGILSWLGGFIVEKGNIHWIFWLFAVFALISAYASSRLPVLEKIDLGGKYWSALRTLSNNRPWIALMIGCLCFGIGLNIQSNYFILDLQSLGAGEALYGMSLMLTCLSEMPIYLISAGLLRKYKPQRLITIAFILLMVRLFLIAEFTDYRWVIATQLMHGITFSLMWTAGINYVKELTPAGTGATAQGLFGAMIWGVGGAIAALFGAQIVAVVGTKILFFAATGITAVGFCIFLFLARSKTASVGKNLR
jgi:PPP family 3-phenylpropionic acid transporter